MLPLIQATTYPLKNNCPINTTLATAPSPRASTGATSNSMASTPTNQCQVFTTTSTRCDEIYPIILLIFNYWSTESTLHALLLTTQHPPPVQTQHSPHLHSLPLQPLPTHHLLQSINILYFSLKSQDPNITWWGRTKASSNHPNPRPFTSLSTKT